MSELTTEQGKTPTLPDYEAYNLLLGCQNMAHPARQGLGRGEYAAAMADPLAASTEVSINGEQLKAPQLVPLKHIKWLNETFYAKKFPSAYDEEKIYCFNNSLDANVGPEAQNALKTLAERQGVLVFDYPTSDPDYVDKLTNMLTGLGIAFGGIEELGTQTYFAGKLKLKRPHEKLERPLSFVDSFKKMVSTGQHDVSRVSNGASLSTEVPLETAQRLNEFYDEAFQVLNEHPCKQGLEPEDFVAMVAEDEEVVKILYTNQGEVETLCILGEDLSKFDWINASFFNAKYPEEYAKKQIAYFPAIATDPSKQGARNSQAIIELLAELCEAGDNEVIVAFDCCDHNDWLADALQVMISSAPESDITFMPVDVQRYCAIKLSA